MTRKMKKAAARKAAKTHGMTVAQWARIHRKPFFIAVCAAILGA